MPMKLFWILPLAIAMAACSGSSTTHHGHDTAESAVVAWFEAVDGSDAASASRAINDESLAILLGIENDVAAEDMARYLDDGVPLDVQAAYWASFSAGFSEFASRPISTLSVGKAELFTSADIEFASVPVGGGAAGSSVVIARMAPDGTWQVDLVASLGDGFVKLLTTEYVSLPAGSAGDSVRAAYADVVVPSLWAAMADRSFGDDFNRAALALIEMIDR